MNYLVYIYKHLFIAAVNLFSQEILSDLGIVEMETGTWRVLAVRQEVWAITLILEERERGVLGTQ